MMTLLRFAVLVALVWSCAGTAALADDDRMTGRHSAAAAPSETDKDAKPAKPDAEKPVKAAAKPKDKDKDAAEKPDNDQPAQKKEAEEAPAPAPTPAPAVDTPRPRTGQTMNRKAMESLGPLTNPLKGGLGNDMWAGTDRAVVQTFLPELPAGAALWPAQLLTRRILISNGDVDMMRNDKAPEPGQDLFTLRIERLIAAGAYDDAVALYTLIEGEPGHSRLARAGVMALMNGGFPAQACLEARAADKTISQDETDSFWPQIKAACTFVEIQSIRAVKDAGFTKEHLKIASQDTATDVPDSKVLTSLVSRTDYRHTIGSPEDLQDLSALERAVLRGTGRLDYSRLKVKKMRAVPAPLLMLMAGDPNMPAHWQLAFNIEAAERGLIDADKLATLYLKLAENGGDDMAIPARYAALNKATAAAEKRAAITAALEDKGRDKPAALIPFAAAINEENPEGLSPDALETGIATILQAGLVPAERWVKAWLDAESGDSRKSRDQVLLYLANLVLENLPTNSIAFPKDRVAPLLTPPDSHESLVIWAVFDAMGRIDLLREISDNETYEKHIDLTVINDYVMPSEGLVEKLRDAAKNGRLGETALLASVALKSDNPATIHPGVIREALKSLETVGLKEEARYMAVGAVLGLKQ